MYPLSQKAIQFLSPATIKEDITSFPELKQFVKQAPAYTVLPIDFFEAMLQKIPQITSVTRGNWVQIGVWKGGGALFLKSLMADLNINHHLYLFDTFGNIPVTDFSSPQDVEFVEQFDMAQNTTKPSYRTDVENLLQKFDLHKHTVLVDADVNHLPPSAVPEQISFLMIDVDFYKPTLASLNLFYDKVIPGGIIIMDDYYLQMVNCKQAVDDFFAQKNIAVETILTKFSSYSAIIVKP
jgi:hypothetical protein